MHDSHRKQPARTTIVGGQPPGNARDLPPVPAGLEDLLSMAATSGEFAAALLRDRSRAAEAAGVSLTPAETAILGAVGEASLTQMIARVGSALPQVDRRLFLERAAAAVALLVGGSALTACGDKTPKGAGTPRGSAPPAPPSRPRKRELDVDGGARPDRAMDPAGIRPDRVFDSAGAQPSRGTDAGTPRPVPSPKPAGIRPDRPKRPDEVHLIGGIQPSRSGPGADAPDEGSTPIGGVRPTRPKPSTP